MPELPEVETIRRDLEKKILCKKITQVFLGKKMKVKQPSFAVVETLLNKNFTSIGRIGKLMYFVINKNRFLLVHLKMTGQLIWAKEGNVVGGGHSMKTEKIDILPNNQTRAWIEFSDKSRLYFNDLRRFGFWQIVDKEALEKIKSGYGIEPLMKNFTLQNFLKALSDKKTVIKAVLLNQSIISGIGNIYADEACFLSGIKPNRRINTLTKKELEKLFLAIKKVIKKAVDKRGTTFNSYVDSDGNKGNFVSHLQVYGRAGEKCHKCQNRLLRIKVAGRGTVYCPRCQP